MKFTVTVVDPKDGSETSIVTEVRAGQLIGEFLEIPADCEATPDKESIYGQIAAITHRCQDDANSEFVVIRIGNRKELIDYLLKNR